MANEFETANVVATLKAISVGKQIVLNDDERFVLRSRGLIDTKIIRFNEANTMKMRDPRRFLRVTPKGRELMKTA